MPPLLFALPPLFTDPAILPYPESSSCWSIPPAWSLTSELPYPPDDCAGGGLKLELLLLRDEVFMTPPPRERLTSLSCSKELSKLPGICVPCRDETELS
jgi:hypothetical protein